MSGTEQQEQDLDKTEKNQPLEPPLKGESPMQPTGITQEQAHAFVAALDAIATHLANVHEVAPGVAVGTDVSVIVRAIDAVRETIR